MRFILSLLMIISMTKECNNNRHSEPVASEIDTEISSEANQSEANITFDYSAISRGTYYKFIITHKTISVQRDLNSEAILKPCSKAEWSKLMSAMKTIDLKNISELKAPTQTRFYDGAAAAQLKVIFKDTTFETQSFDHGTPPKAIEAFVNDILSLCENVE